MSKQESAFAQDPLLCAVKAAEYLSIHQETLRKLARQRQIPYVRAAGSKSHFKFRLSALNAWASKHTVPAARR